MHDIFVGIDALFIIGRMYKRSLKFWNIVKLLLDKSLSSFERIFVKAKLQSLSKPMR